MKKYIVLGVNENPKYLYYLPLVVWAWGRYGWDVDVFYIGRREKFLPTTTNLNDLKVFIIDPSPKYKTETVAQVIRLHAASFRNNDAYFMTSDVDMLPLSDYWNPDLTKITTYGRDLTDYHYPICYIGMNRQMWYDVMGNGYIYPQDWYDSSTYYLDRDLNEYKNKHPNAWTTDQQIITERLLRYGTDKIIHINRGTDKRTGYPLGRVDRSNWRLDHPQLIDAHLPHDILTNDESFRKVMQLLHLVWPKEDFKWFLEYHRDFKKLL